MRFVIFSIFALLVVVLMVILCFRAIYVAFVIKKDERSKLIVTKSMAHSFIATVVLQTLQFIIKWLNYDAYTMWWASFKESVYIEPVLLSFLILGIILIINTKKYGGSL